MKKSQLLFSTIALPIDYLMLILAGWLAYQLRFVSFIRATLPIRFDLPPGKYISTLAIVALIWLVLFSFSGLYNLNNRLKLSQEFGRIFLGCTAGLAIIILLFFFNPKLFDSRFIILVSWALALVLVSLGRLLLRLIRSVLYYHGIGITKVLLIGDDQASQFLHKLFDNKPKFGFVIVKKVGSTEIDLAKDTIGIDEVLVGDVSLSREFNLDILEFCITHHLGFKYVADMFEAQSHNVVSHTFAGLPIIEIKRTALDGWGRIIKRLVDLLFSFILLILLLPVLFIISLLILIDSGRPIIISLKRVGENGQFFNIYKFRSMVKNAAKMKNDLLVYNERSDGPLFKMKNDPRVTKIGRWLRQTSLDEVPQLWNVLIGQMSLVGPRPHEPEEVAKYQSQHRRLLNIKPGITGLAQVSGRSGLNFEEEVKLDTFYVENWSFGQDFIILIKTIFVVWQRQSAV